MKSRSRARAGTLGLLHILITIALLLVAHTAAVAQLPEANPDHFLLVAACNPAPDTVQIEHGHGTASARPAPGLPGHLVAELPRGALGRDGSFNLRFSTDARAMSRWAVYVLPGWSPEILGRHDRNWLRAQSLCFEEGLGNLPERLTLDRYPAVTVDYDDSAITSMQVAGQELLGGAPSGFSIGDTLAPLEGINRGSTGTARFFYRDPEQSANTLLVVADRSETDRIRFECTYTVNEPRDESVPVHLVLRPQGRAMQLRTYTWRRAGHSTTVEAPEGGGEEYAPLAQTPFAQVRFDNGAWLGALDYDQTNVILSTGRDEAGAPFVRVSTYLWPREAPGKYEWSFELIAGCATDSNALLQAMAPHTAGFEEHYKGALVDEQQAEDPQAAYAAGARVMWRHGWFYRNGVYFDPDQPFDETYQTVRGETMSYAQLQSNIDAAQEAGLACNVYFQMGGISEDITDRFADSVVRGPDGNPVVTGRDGNYLNIWGNPDPEGTLGASVLKQVDDLLTETGADGIALDRTDRLDFTHDPDIYDYGSFNGYSSVFEHEGARRPVSSLTMTAREWLTQLRAIADSHDAGILSNSPLSPRVVRLSDGLLIDQRMTPDTMFFFKALANGKSLYLLDVNRDLESPSDEPLVARLAQTRPYLSPGGRWEDPRRLGRLLYAISEDADYPTLWYFDNGHTRMNFDPDADTVPAMYSGSEFVRMDQPPADSRPGGETIAMGGAAPAERTQATGTPAERFAKLPRFGMSVFGRDGDEARAEADTEEGEEARGEAVPPTYVIGPGDELAVRVWTDAVEHISSTPTVDPDGDIYLDLLGAINVAGESLAEVRNMLKARFAEFFNRAQVQVGLARTRVIEVRVTGDVTRPGKYRLSGAATVFTALYAAGGPSEIGSLRRIRLLRTGAEPVEIDLYNYLLQGDPSGDMPLNPEDTVFVAPSGPTVGITGQIQRPARYEMTETATLPHLIEMAGGLAATAYTPSVQVWRIGLEGERQLLNVDLSEALRERFELRGGDLVVIPSVIEEPRNVVEIEGPVRRPGTYQYREGLTVSELVSDARGLTMDAHMEEAWLWQLNEDLDYEMSTVDLRSALRGNPDDNHLLGPGDRLVILAEDDVEAPPLISIQGPVREPGEKTWTQGMRISDLVKQAGGLVEGAWTDRAELLRLGEDQRRELIPVDLAAALRRDPDADLTLQRGDTLRLLRRSEIAEASEVHVTGLVRDEGWYPRPQGMRVSDAILAAGGLAASAGNQVEYTPGGAVKRVEPIYLQLRREGEQFTVEPDPIVRDNDLVAVLGTGELIPTAPTVTIRGRVEQPGSYALQETSGNADTVYDLIQRAGGLLSDANPNGIVLYRLRQEIIGREQSDDLQQVISHFNRELAAATVEGEEQRAAGSAQQISQGLQAALSEGAATVVIPPRRLSESRWARAVPIDGETLISTDGRREDFPLAPGDVVVVPRTPTTVTVMGAVVRPGAVPYDDGLDAHDYIARSGDLTPDARKRRTVIIRANGEVAPKALHAEIRPGDIILVPSDYIFRNVNQPGTLERVLTAVTSIVTGYLIFN